MESYLGEVGDIADVVAFAVFIDVFVTHAFAAQSGDAIEGFQDADAVVAAASQVVDLHPRAAPSRTPR